MRKYIEMALVGVVFAVLGMTFIPNKDVMDVHVAQEMISDFLINRACADPLHEDDMLLNRGGNYLCTRGGTVNSGISYPLSATYATNTAMFVIQNPASATRAVIPGRITLKANQTSGTVGVTSTEYAVEIDKDAGAGISRVPFPVGRILPTPINNNGWSTATAQAVFYGYNAGVPLSTPAATANARVVGRGTMSFGQQVSGDELVLRFSDYSEGGIQTPLFSQTPAATTPLRIIPSKFISNTAPTVVPPGWYFIFHFWLNGAAASVLPAYEPEVCWYEK